MLIICESSHTHTVLNRRKIEERFRTKFKPFVLNLFKKGPCFCFEKVLRCVDNKNCMRMGVRVLRDWFFGDFLIEERVIYLMYDFFHWEGCPMQCLQK